MVGDNMKIIDFDKKGNLVRFYLGYDNCNDYWGDDWNDTPYEHNAGPVYDTYIKEYIDVCFPFDSVVLEPQNDWRCRGNSNYCKADMKDGIVPCIIVIPKEVAKDNYCDDEFGCWVGAKNIEKFYFNDDVGVIENSGYICAEERKYEQDEVPFL